MLFLAIIIAISFHDEASIDLYHDKIRRVNPQDIHHQIMFISHLQVEYRQTKKDRPFDIVKEEYPGSIEVFGCFFHDIFPVIGGD